MRLPSEVMAGEAAGVFRTRVPISGFCGSHEKAALTMSLVYLVGLIVIWFVPETKGCKLPE